MWAPDGRRVIYESSSPAALMALASDGTSTAPEPVSPEGHFHPHAMSADGTEIIAVVLDTGTIGSQTGADIVRVKGAKNEPEPIVRTQYREGFEGASLSPDRKWLAYVSNATGTQEIWIQPYPGPGAPVRVSPNSGIEPVWARNGRELFYVEGRRMMAVSLDLRAGLSFLPAKQLFELDYTITAQPPSYDVAADGRFLMIKPADGQPQAAPIVVSLNWFEELKQRLP
jgi:Tol biopolymer transport system component